MLSLNTHGRVSVGSKILYGHLGTRGDTSGYLAAPYGYVSVVNKFKWLIIYKNRGRKWSQKCARKLAYKAPENAPNLFYFERQYLRNYLLSKIALPLIGNVFSMPFHQVLVHFCSLSSSRANCVQRKFVFS